MTTTDVLSALLRTNLAAGVAVIAVTLIRKPVRRWLGARLAYGLWVMPALAALAVLIPARQVVVTPQATLAGVPAVAMANELDLASGFDPGLLLIGLWLTGVVIAAMVMAHMQRRFLADVAIGKVGPAVVGIISPRIITPAGFDMTFSAEEQALVLAHEQAHIVRHDSRTNAVSVLAQCLFWFNPLVHLAAHLARIDQEMACDEAVITRFPDARRAYARALVKAQLALRPLPLGCYWPSGTGHPLEERIVMLKAKTLPPALRLAGASALALVCAGAGLAAWAAQPPRMVITTLAPVMAAAAPATLRPTQAATTANSPTPLPTREAPKLVGQAGVISYVMPRVLSDYQGADGQRRQVRLGVTFELANTDAAAALNENMPRINEMLQSYLRELRPEDLGGPDDDLRLHQEVMQRVNLIISPNRINSVDLTELVFVM